MLGSAVEEQGAIVERGSLVIIEEAALPDFPGSRVLQLRDWSVQQGDGRAGFVVRCNPVNGSIDPV